MRRAPVATEGRVSGVVPGDDGVEVEVLGESTNGEPYVVVAVSAPENLQPSARQRNAEIEQLQRDLVALEAAPAPGRVRKIDPAVAVEVMQEGIARSDTKKKRAFLGAFIERVSMGVDTVTVEYRGEALLAILQKLLKQKNWQRSILL